MAVHGDPAAERWLVAYLVTGDGTAPQDWRERLAAVLPAAMCHGRRRARRAAADRRTASSTGPRCPHRDPAAAGAGAAPRTRRPSGSSPTSGPRCSAATRIGVDDDFFALGGHSLPAMTVAARLSARVRRAVSVRSVFARPTVADWPPRSTAAPRRRPAGTADRAADPDADAPSPLSSAPAAAVVPAPARPGRRRLQHDPRLPAARPARRGPRCAQRSAGRRPPRGAAHPVPGPTAADLVQVAAPRPAHDLDVADARRPAGGRGAGRTRPST